MKKYWIKDLTEKQVIHVPTKKISEKLCKRFDELNLKWFSGDSYLFKNKWEYDKEETCYRPATGTFGSKKWYEDSDYEILTIDQLLDFQELVIEVSKFYRTRDGRKVCIYSTQNGGDYPIHGAIEINGNWEVYSWKEGGEYHEEISQFHLDIVSEWVDEIEFDVEALPKWRYIAMDKLGGWFIYTGLPTRKTYVWKTDNEGFYALNEDDYPKNYNGSWEESLHEIVNGELIKVDKEHA